MQKTPSIISHDKLDIPYSVGGMAQYYESLVELLEYRLTSNIKKVIINTSVQPNSIPHFGTITTFFCTFIFAKMINDYFRIDVGVEIDFIECCPSSEYHINGGDYCYSIARTQSTEDPSKSIADYFIETYYLPLLQWSGTSSGINYSTRSYKSFQKEVAVRTAMIAICADRTFFELLLNPKHKKLHIRPECPTCGCVDKLLKMTAITDVSSSGFCISSYCGKHGPYSVDICKSNQNYIEINTQMRDITKGALMESYLDDDVLGIMFDGGDWGGAWTHRVHCESLQRLGYHLPLRLFAPLILDWSGGKLSKSIYLKDATAVENSFEDYKLFMEKFGEEGLLCIYNEVFDWLSMPKKFFRNYSKDYILEILKRFETAQ